MRKILILFVFLLPSAGITAQTEMAVMKLSPNPVGINDNISLILEVPAQSVAEVDVSSIQFPPGVQIRRGPYLRPFYTTDPWGNRIPHVRISYTLRSRRAGRFAMGPLAFTVADRPWATEQLLLEVGTYRSRRLTFPLEVEWQTPSDFVYQGEAVPMTLTVLRQREIGLFDPPSVTPPRTGFFEEARGIDAISTEEIGGVTLYNVPAVSYLYTPSSAGEITFQGGRVTQGDLSTRSERITLDILPLPPEVETTGAVGRFQVSGSSNDENPPQGGELRFTLTVSGEGNLNYLIIPDIQVRGGSILSSEEESSYAPSSGGYRGVREKIFTILVDDSRSLTVMVPPFPYVEKPSGAVRIQPQFRRIFQVVTAASGEEEETAALPIGKIGEGSSLFFYPLDYRKHPLLWLFLLPCPVIFLVVRIFRGTGKKRGLTVLLALLISVSLGAQEGEGLTGILEDVRLLVESGEMEQAKQLLTEFPGETGLGARHHALGVIAGGEEKWDEAVWHLRTAVKREPMKGAFRKSVSEAESRAGIRDAYPLRLPLDGRLLFLLLIAAVNGTALAGIFLLYKPHGGGVILLILFLAASAGSGGLLGLFELNKTRDLGVVFAQEGGEDTHLKRIPRDEAEDWFPLRPGTTLRIKEKVGEYFLVENGASVNGWIHQDRIKEVGTDG